MVYENARQHLDCLSQARLKEKNAASAERSREASPGSAAVDPPPEFSDRTIAKYYLQAARMYEAAGTYAVLREDLCRAFKRFRKAAKCGGRCNELLEPAIPTFVPPWPTTAKKRP